ncbi:thioredoxin fold domain-containing protein [Flavobacterium gelidilacus]|jgi:thioredoxin-related protein|uniref:thioredoxin family protein n=1 Tax=Flavobacterium gelidilacus TaxID=206041 RepID=UPI0004029D1A|nr:thioredoxin fold domain-containing protein [Flavobacterium gelidilacus]
MKKILFILFVTLSSILVQAQEDLIWHTDMAKASELSMKEKKPLMLFFTGSDWCGWCIRLQNEVFKKDEFTKWAKENVILVELDYPRRTPQDQSIKQQNQQMQQIFQVRGYPTIWLVNPEKTDDGKVNLSALGSTGYVAGGPEKWLEGANSIIKK